MFVIWRLIRWLIRLVFGCVGLVVAVIVGINLFVIGTAWPQTKSVAELKATDYQADDVPIMVLGAGIINNQEPSGVLAKRLDKAIELAQAFPNKALIMSGDHEDRYYNEVQVMKDYLIAHGIDSQRIYLDHAGYSTYESLHRLKHTFKQSKAIVVTQGYHLSRALMLARKVGLDAVGVPAEEIASTRFNREVREVGARLKDFAVTYLGYRHVEPTDRFGFDLSESGDVTDSIDVEAR